MNIEQIHRFLKYSPQTKSILLRGNSGLGKTSFVNEFAANMGYKLINLRLGELEPTDITGMPVKEQKEDGTWITKYAQPYWWPEDGKTVIFLDETDRCSRDLHPIAMQLADQRRAGQRDLPKGIYIFAAVNGDAYPGTIPMCQAFMRRFATIEFEPTVEEWVIWAKRNNVNNLIVEFIEANKDTNNMLDTPEDMVGQPNIVAPTRCSWVEFGQWLDNASKELSGLNGISVYAEPLVGDAAAQAFEQWAIDRYKPINAEDIFSGRFKIENQEKINIIQLAAVAEIIATQFMNRTNLEQINALNCFKAGGIEIFAALFSKLPRQASFIMRKNEDIHTFIKENLFGLEPTEDWKNS